MIPIGIWGFVLPCYVFLKCWKGQPVYKIICGTGTLWRSDKEGDDLDESAEGMKDAQ